MSFTRNNNPIQIFYNNFIELEVLLQLQLLCEFYNYSKIIKVNVVFKREDLVNQETKHLLNQSLHWIIHMFLMGVDTQNYLEQLSKWLKCLVENIYVFLDLLLAVQLKVLISHDQLLSHVIRLSIK